MTQAAVAARPATQQGVPTKARTPFWYTLADDAEAAAACRWAPTHNWHTATIESLLDTVPTTMAEGSITFCGACYVARCTVYTRDKRCVLPAAHTGKCYPSWQELRAEEAA